jgi:fatty acid desaturase
MNAGSTWRASTIEWPTLILALVTYVSWGLALLFHDHIPIWLLIPIGGWLIAWHGSLQHETIHGHPTNMPWINALIGGLPLSLWLPYRCYRRDHMAHHATDSVTDPIADPESRYLPSVRDRMTPLRLAVAAVQGPLPGRLLLGPCDVVGRFLVSEAKRLGREPAQVAWDWLPHVIGLAAVGAWLAYCHVSLGFYLLVFVYPGTALSLLRSFAEHRAADRPGHRVAVVEKAGPFALLFLHNNLHAAHHSAPAVPWYRLPDHYRRNRAAILSDNGGLLYAGYGDVARRFWRRPHDALIHPGWP